MNGNKNLLRQRRLGRCDTKIVRGYEGVTYDVTFHDEVVLDIGANIGGVTCMAARTALRVFAFEPVCDNYAVFTVNIRNQQLKNIHTFRVGVGDDAPCTIYTDSENPGQ